MRPSGSSSSRQWGAFVPGAEESPAARQPPGARVEGELLEIFQRRLEARAVKGKDGTVALAATVFHYRGGEIRCFKNSWKSATERAGVPGLLFHDLRRSGVRGMIRAGLDEHVAMRISGHLTPSVFRRYDIVDEEDLRDAVRMVERHARRGAKKRAGEEGE